MYLEKLAAIWSLTPSNNASTARCSWKPSLPRFSQPQQWLLKAMERTQWRQGTSGQLPRGQKQDKQHISSRMPPVSTHSDQNLVQGGGKDNVCVRPKWWIWHRDLQLPLRRAAERESSLHWHNLAETAHQSTWMLRLAAKGTISMPDMALVLIVTHCMPRCNQDLFPFPL